jgi:hypothetical protein
VGANAPLKNHYSYCYFAYFVKKYPVLRFLELSAEFIQHELCGRHSQVGSLAGAAHLLKSNAGVLR